MVAKEVFINYYSSNPIWVQHASIHVKNVLVLKSKKVIFKVSYKSYSESGLLPEPQFGFAAPRSRSRKKYFRLRSTDKNTVLHEGWIRDPPKRTFPSLIYFWFRIFVV
jgi:hypothetical protein